MISEWIAADRRDLAGVLDGLSAEQWDAPSLCDGWAVRHVVAHLTMPLRYSPPRFLLRLAAAGGRFQKMSDGVARRDGELPRAQLIATLRDRADYPWKPPGGGLEGVADPPGGARPGRHRSRWAPSGGSRTRPWPPCWDRHRAGEHEALRGRPERRRAPGHRPGLVTRPGRAAARDRGRPDPAGHRAPAARGRAERSGRAADRGRAPVTIVEDELSREEPNPDELSRTFAALADPTRRAIVARLAAGRGNRGGARGAVRPDPAGDLQAPQGAGAGRADLAEPGGPGPAVPAGAEHLDAAATWIERHRQIWAERYDRLDEHLAELRDGAAAEGEERS